MQHALFSSRLVAAADRSTAVEADDLTELRILAAGIRHDLQTVTVGLTLRYSSGKDEGHRSTSQIYGRAEFDLLHKRVILRPA